MLKILSAFFILPGKIILTPLIVLMWMATKTGPTINKRSQAKGYLEMLQHPGCAGLIGFLLIAFLVFVVIVGITNPKTTDKTSSIYNEMNTYCMHGPQLPTTRSTSPTSTIPS